MGKRHRQKRRREKRESYEREVATRLPRKTFLIVCEGTKTEPNYFRSFEVLSAKVEIRGTGRNTLSLVHYAERILDERDEEFDEVWLVFDKDSFSSVSFNNAVFFCQAHHDEGFRVAYSNEAFELWYLLHFELITKPISRFNYNAMLSKRMKTYYKKNLPNMYQQLLPRQPLAIENAKLLYEKRSNSPAKDNPSTTVFQLVEELNSHLRD
ncbi:MAG TPA: RloB family protein [Candidatus Jeotgalibaca merdavium]|uniref:RloB domain-containing protein n=2 Tax=Jeotgalibaca TaxID=1470540 RepID=A0A6G7KB81_9LACT|nr:RloB family protein [Jeotgalibaca arthritidis]QII82461.1 RloB domain-containing protein [Jeotgalibaca arthritidis]HJA89476.1 RloB family protein [Candidatus Jeotgalibaca merdavium]